MKNKIKLFIEDRKETIVKASVCVAAGALLSAIICNKTNGQKTIGVGASLDSDGNVFVNVLNRNGTSEVWTGTPNKI